MECHAPVAPPSSQLSFSLVRFDILCTFFVCVASAFSFSFTYAQSEQREEGRRKIRKRNIITTTKSSSHCSTVPLSQSFSLPPPSVDVSDLFAVSPRRFHLTLTKWQTDSGTNRRNWSHSGAKARWHRLQIESWRGRVYCAPSCIIPFALNWPETSLSNCLCTAHIRISCAGLAALEIIFYLQLWLNGLGWANLTKYYCPSSEIANCSNNCNNPIILMEFRNFRQAYKWRGLHTL